ncbi:MAG: SET domain-containing protein-lysine N-methyltransferase [Thermoanaerobaculia bacterium]|nr:SET domain-containing protein-lysine N-methyltransferase [Thermoanaerobaculia bacterium]
MTHNSPTVASWRSPKTEIRTSSTQGRGVFAIEPIPSGEIVAVKGGHIVDSRQLEALRSIVGAAEVQIADDLYLVPRTPEEHDAVMMFLNHSCQPNAGVRGNVVFVAMRTLATGEEITIDYAMIDDGDFSMDCSCGAVSCRRVIHGKDWQRPELQHRYAGFFSTYLEDRIARGGTHPSGE